MVTAKKEQAGKLALASQSGNRTASANRNDTGSLQCHDVAPRTSAPLVGIPGSVVSLSSGSECAEMRLSNVSAEPLKPPRATVQLPLVVFVTWVTHV